MRTADVFLVGAAFVVTIASASGEAPLWVAVLLLALRELLTVLGR